MHMWMEARRDWRARMAAVPASSAAFPPVPGTTALPAPAPVPEDKAPKNFPQWAAQIERYNGRLFEGKRRHFPDRLLVGAESILARMWWEHETKAFTPVSLGEIVSKRTFQASGEINHVAVSRASQSSQTLRVVGAELVASEDKPWDPRSLIALVDGAEAARWAMSRAGAGGGRQPVRGLVHCPGPVQARQGGSTPGLLAVRRVAHRDGHARRGVVRDRLR